MELHGGVEDNNLHMILEFTEIEATIPGEECTDIQVAPDAEAPEKLDLNMDNIFKVYAYKRFLIPLLILFLILFLICFLIILLIPFLIPLPDPKI